MSEEKVYICYDGALGPEVRVRVDAQTTAHFTADRPLLPLPARAATSLLSPAVGGGHYHRAIPLEEAAKRFGVRIEGPGGLQDLAIRDVTVKNYLPKGAAPEASPVVCLVLDPKSVKRLRTAAPLMGEVARGDLAQVAEGATISAPSAPSFIEPVQTSAPLAESSTEPTAEAPAAATKPRSAAKKGGAQ